MRKLLCALALTVGISALGSSPVTPTASAREVVVVRVHHHRYHRYYYNTYPYYRYHRHHGVVIERY